MQVTDISAFDEASAFYTQMDHLVKRCVKSKPADPAKPVRVPGQRGLALKTQELKNGVALRSDILSAFTELAAQVDVALPVPIVGS